MICLQALRSKLSLQPCSDVLADKDRQLVFHGQLRLLEGKSRTAKDVDVFLFTDLLLLTHQNTAPMDKRSTKKEVLFWKMLLYILGVKLTILML